MSLMRMLSIVAALLAAGSASASCIHGTTRTSAGAPIAGASVTLLAEQKSVNAGSSDARGSFRVDPKRRGDFDVLIVAAGYAPQLLHASAGKNVGVVTLIPAPEIAATLQCDAHPIAEAVSFVLVGKDGAEVAMTTDSAGAVRLADPTVWVERVVVIGHENERCNLR